MVMGPSPLVGTWTKHGSVAMSSCAWGKDGNMVGGAAGGALHQAAIPGGHSARVQQRTLTPAPARLSTYQADTRVLRPHTCTPTRAALLGGEAR